ncbi:MAG: hypothetical protein ACOCWL_02790, partial [Thermoguttaceae bacterium]
LARDELENQKESLRKAQETLEQERRDLHRDEEELRTQLSRERERLEQERERLQGERASLEDERCRFESERAKLAAGREAAEALPAEVVEASEAEVGHGRPEAAANEAPDAEANDDEAAAEEAPDEEASAEEAPEESPVDLAEVLRRLGKADLLRADNDRDAVSGPESDDSLSPAAGAREPSIPTNTAGSPEATTEHHDDVSVDEYMSQLMQRVRGTSASESVWQPNRPVKRNAETQSAPPDAPAPSAGPAPPKPVKRKPRGPAPERTGFAAMRELANVSARSAVDQHARRQMISISRSKLAVATTAALAGLVLSWLWATYAPIGVTLLAAATSFSIALLWALQYAVVTGRLLIGANGLIRFRRSCKTENRPAEDADATEPSASA